VKLLDYLTALDGSNRTPAPDELLLPGELVQQLSKLYTAAEHLGREHGCVLFCDRGSRTFSYGEVAAGGPMSMNIPVSTHVNNFGNVHAHPTASIGHAGGFSAHSTQDLRKFKDTQDRPYFIQLVVCGPVIYAMVQVKGVSVWDDSASGFLGKLQGVEEGAMLGAIVDALGSEEAYLARREPVQGDAEGLDRVMTELKDEANVGGLMQTMSIRSCTAFAKAYTYFFYAGEGDVLKRTT
jgi:hypothetical protein